MNEDDYQKQIEEQAKLQQQIAMIEAKAKGCMSAEAIARYGALKSAHPEKALQVVMIIAQAAENNQLKEKITDQQFKNILMQLQQPKKEFKLTRK